MLDYALFISLLWLSSLCKDMQEMLLPTANLSICQVRKKAKCKEWFCWKNKRKKTHKYQHVLQTLNNTLQCRAQYNKFQYKQRSRVAIIRKDCWQVCTHADWLASERSATWINSHFPFHYQFWTILEFLSKAKKQTISTTTNKQINKQQQKTH